jgi:transposase
MTLRGAATGEHLAAIVAAFLTRVLSLGPGVQIVLATESIDLRRGHDGLVTLVRSLWKADPYSGTLFVFFGRRMDRVKVLFFSAGGFVVYYKRLERGRFSMPRVPEGASQIVLEPGSLAMLLDGIDLRAVRRTTMWQPTAKKTA